MSPLDKFREIARNSEKYEQLANANLYNSPSRYHSKKSSDQIHPVGSYCVIGLSPEVRELITKQDYKGVQAYLLTHASECNSLPTTVVDSLEEVLDLGYKSLSTAIDKFNFANGVRLAFSMQLHCARDEAHSTAYQNLLLYWAAKVDEARADLEKDKVHHKTSKPASSLRDKL